MTTRQIIRRIARENNTTPKQVEREMKEAIRAGMASDVAGNSSAFIFQNKLYEVLGYGGSQW